MKKVLSFLILFLTAGVITTFAQGTRENYYLLGPQSDGPAQKDAKNNDIKKVDFFNTALKLQPVEGSNSKYYIEIPALYPYESGKDLASDCILNYGLVVNTLNVDGVGYDASNFIGGIYIDIKDFNVPKSQNNKQEFRFSLAGLKDPNFVNSSDKLLKFLRLSFYNPYKCSYIWRTNNGWALIDDKDDKSSYRNLSDEELKEKLSSKNLTGEWFNGTQHSESYYDFLDSVYDEEFLNRFFKKVEESKNKFEQQAKENFYGKFINYFNNKGFSFYVAKESTITKAHSGELKEYEALKQLIVPSTADDADGNHYVFGKNRKSGSFTTYNNTDKTKNRWEIRFNNLYSKKDITKNLEVLYGQLQPNTGGAYDAKTNNTVLCRLTENGRDKLILDGSYRFTIDVATKTWSVEYQEKRVSYLMAYTTQWQNWKVNSVTTLYDEKDPTLKAYGKYHNKFTTPYTYMFREADGDGHKYCYDFMQNNDKSTGCEEYLRALLKKEGVLRNSKEIEVKYRHSGNDGRVVEETQKVWADDLNEGYNVSEYAPFVPFIGSVPYLISFGPSVNGSSTEINAEKYNMFKGCLVMEPGYGSNLCTWPQGGYMNVAQYSYSLANHGYVTINDGRQDKAMLQSILICQGAKLIKNKNGITDTKSTEGGALSSSEPLLMSYKPSLKAYSIEVPARTFHNGKFYFLGLDDYIASEEDKKDWSDLFKDLVNKFEANKNALEAYDHNYVFYNTGNVDYPTVSNPNAQTYERQSGLTKTFDDFKNYFKSIFSAENVDKSRLNTFKEQDEKYDGYYRINLYITSSNEAHYTIEKIGYRFKGVSLMAQFADGKKADSNKSYPISDSQLWGEKMTYVSEGIPHYELKISKERLDKIKGNSTWQSSQRFCFEALLDDGSKVLFGQPNPKENTKSLFESVAKWLKSIKESVSGYDDNSLNSYSNCEARTDDIAPDHIGVDGATGQFFPNNGGADLPNIDIERCDLVFGFYPLYGKYAVYTITPLINKVEMKVLHKKKILSIDTYTLKQRTGSDKQSQYTFDSDDKDIIKMEPGDLFVFKVNMEANKYAETYFGQNIKNTEEEKAYSIVKASDGFYYMYPIVTGHSISFNIRDILNKNFDDLILKPGEVPEVPEGYTIQGYKVKDFFVLPLSNTLYATYKLVPILNGKAVADDDIEKEGMTKITFANTGVKEMPYIRTWSSSAYSYSYAEGSKNKGRVTAYRVDNVKFDGEQHADGTSNLKVYLRKVEDDDIHANEGLVLIPTLKYDNDGNIITNKYCEVDDENTVTVYLKPDDSKNDMPYELNYLQPSGEGKTVRFEDYDSKGENIIARNYFLSTWHKTVDYPEYGGDDYVGFFRAITSKLGANKAYLSLSADVPEFDFNGRQIDVSGNKNYTFDELTDASSSSAKFGVMLVFDDIDDDSNTTGISGIKAASMNDDAYYSLSGERTTTPHAGKMYIHGGKKVVIVK